jgi:hypothetical protein
MALKQENQSLQNYCKGINKQLDAQQTYLQAHLSIKLLAFQFALIGIISSMATILALNTFPPTVKI